MTSDQIKSLNLMACSSPTHHHEFMFNGEMITLSVMSYDHTTNEGHWTLSYPSYMIDLYSHMDIPPYDKRILRYMYDEYMTYYDKLLSNNRAI